MIVNDIASWLITCYYWQVDGRRRPLKYIARINKYDEQDNDYEGVFWEKVPQKLEDHDSQTFIVNDEMVYSFAATDILVKLPYPNALKGVF